MPAPSLSVQFPTPARPAVSVQTIADLRAYPLTSITTGFNAIVDCRTTLGDGLGGLYTWSPTSTAADNGASVIAPNGVSTGRWVYVAIGAPGPAGATGPKGDPGASGFSVGLSTAITGITVPVGTDTIRTSGKTILGKGAATYVRTTESLPSWGSGLWWFTDAAGAKFKLNEPLPNSDMFGTVGDASNPYDANTITGTDVTTILNAFTYYAELYAIKEIVLSRGSHRVSDTIHVGRGVSFSSVLLRGETDRPFSGWDNFGGSILITDKNDRPCVNTQGGRNSGCHNIVVYGPLLKHVVDNRLGLGSAPGPAILDTDVETWLPSSGSHTNGRFNSGCGFAVDGYSGTRFTAPARATGTSYTRGDYVTNSGNTYKCVGATNGRSFANGVSGGGSGPSGTGTAIADGEVIWKFVGSGTVRASYPDAPYAAYEASTTQFGRNFSSAPSFDGSVALGFTVGLAVQPSNSDGNADFTRFPNFCAEFCAVGISVGNSQSRGLDSSNLTWVFLHTVMAGDFNGNAVGYLGGTHTNWSGGHQLQLLSYSAGYNPSVALTDPYFECGWRIASLSGGGAAIVFARAQFYFGEDISANVLRGTPLNHIGLGATNCDQTSTPIRIYDGQVIVKSLFIVNGLDVLIDARFTSHDRVSGSTIPLYAAQAHNALAGGWAVPYRKGAGGNADQRVKVASTFHPFNNSTGTSPGSFAYFDGQTAQFPTRLIPAPIYAERLRPKYSARTIHNIDMPSAALGAGSFTTKTLVGRKLTMVNATFNSPLYRQQFNFDVGDIIWNDSNGLWAFISSFDEASGTIIAKLQNGYYDDGAGTITYPSCRTGSFDLTAGTYWFMSGRTYCPNYVLFGDFASSSSTVSNVMDATGATSSIADIGVGDAFLVDPYSEGFFAQIGATVSAVGSTTLTMTGGASGKTVAGKRLVMRRSGITPVTNP